MKNLILYLVIGVIATTNIMHAQEKDIELEIEIVSYPEVIPCDGEIFEIEYKITNNGPDNLVEGQDEILFFGPHIGLEDGPEFFSISLAATESVTRTLELTYEDVVFLLDPISRDPIDVDYIEGDLYLIGVDAVPMNEDGFHNDPIEENNSAYTEVYWCTNGTSSIFTPEIYESVQFYPNPTSQELNFTTELSISGDLKVTIYDMMGRKTVEKLFQNVRSGSNRFTIDVSSLPSGMYSLEYSQGDAKGSGKFIKE